MVANTPPTRFTLDPARADEFIDDLSAVENSLRHVAEKWNTTTGALSLFLASPEGLAIVAAAEIATAVHIRLQAQALLVDVAQSMVYIVREYSREERRIPFNNDLRSIKLVELRRANARRAGNLLLRLAHYNPAPIRSYTVRPMSTPTPPCGTAVALDSRGLEHESHACAEPQACHTNETSAPVPPVRRFGATGAVALTPSAPTPTPTSIQTESAREFVVHVGEANTALLCESASDDASLEHPALPNDESDFRSSKACSQTAACEAALRCPHARTASHEHRTPKGSSPLQTSDPPSSDSGP